MTDSVKESYGVIYEPLYITLFINGHEVSINCPDL